MRIRITFKLRNRGAYVPFHHQFLISEVLSGLMEETGEKQFLNFTRFSFSALKGQTQISRNGLHFNSSRVTLVITSPDEDFIGIVVESIFKQDQLVIGQLELAPEQVDIEVPPIIEPEQKFICISPLVIVAGKLNSEEGKRFIEPGTDEFSDLLFEVTVHRMKQAGYQIDQIENLEKFELVPDLVYIDKLRKSQKKFARIYTVHENDIDYEIRGYTFPFVLYASQEVLEFVFTCGLGLYCHKGFGMLDEANRNPVQQLEPYPLDRKMAI